MCYDQFFFYYVVPLVPTGFRIAQVYFFEFSFSVILKWNIPTGKGPEDIVDNYTLSVRDNKMVYDEDWIVSTPLNVTDLIYNREYEAVLVASNCAGESSIQTSFLFSKS